MSKIVGHGNVLKASAYTGGGGGGGGAHGLMSTPNFGALATDHTLPAKFVGVGLAFFRASTDFPTTAYRNAMSNLAPEVLRLNGFHSPGTVASPNSNFTAMHDLCVFLGSSIAVAMGPTGGHPNSADGTVCTIASNALSNQAADGTGHSPNDHAAWYQKFVNDGINVIGYEFVNEPDNSNTGSSGSPGGNDGPWYTLDKACVTWAAVQHRNWTAAIRSKATALGVTAPRIGGGVIGSAHLYAQGWNEDFISGVCADGGTWPYADGNWAYTDTIVFHPYQGGTTNQAKLNSIYWNPQPLTDSNTSIGTTSALYNLRSFMDSHGHTEIKLCYNEYGDGAGTAFSGLIDVAQGILGLGWQSIYNIDYITSWSGNASTDVNDFPICDPSTYTLNTRACAQRDLVFYFSRNYKTIIAFGQNGPGTAAGGDVTGLNNSVPSLPFVIGRSADNHKLGILVCNLDLANAHSFTPTWTDATATGNVVGRQLLSSTTVTGTTSLPTVSFTPSANTFTRTIEAGAAYLFEVPI